MKERCYKERFKNKHEAKEKAGGFRSPKHKIRVYQCKVPSCNGAWHTTSSPDRPKRRKKVKKSLCVHVWKREIRAGKYKGEYVRICKKCGFKETYEKDYT